MSNIRIIFKNGKTREFLHEGRAGGSYTKTLKYKEGFVIIKDEYDRTTSFPSEDIEEVIEEPHYRSF